MRAEGDFVKGGRPRGAEPPVRRGPPLAPVLLLGLVSVSPPAEAQRFSAELSGSVVDETGGVIPGADVTLVNEASRSERRAVTNADGLFAFAAVPAARYRVTVALLGFAPYEYTDIVLRAGDSRRLRPMALRVAAVAETVSVSAEVELAPLDSGEKSATLDSQVIEQVPTVSSNAVELLRILPGMTPFMGSNNQPAFTGEVIGINGAGEGADYGGQSPISNYSSNGANTLALDVTIDGAPALDPGCNCATSVNPNTEMVQELKVLQASFGAEHSRGPSAISVVSRSGGRELHGSAFLYLRDHRLNSNDWFANKVGDPRPESRYLYPGFTLSGPLSLGRFNRDRDKLFFFLGYEYYDQRLDTGYARSWVPTAAMRGGDFRNAAGVGSGSYVNTTPHLGGVPTPVIPGDAIDPGGRVLLDRFPLPNADPAVSGGYNYLDTLVTSQPNHQLLARLDWNVSAATKAFARYNLQRETQPFAYGLWWRGGERHVPYPTPTIGDNRSDSVSLSLTHVFSPTLTSETVVAYTYVDFQNSFDDVSAVSRSALGYPYQGVFGASNDRIPDADPGYFGGNGPVYGTFGGFEPVQFATKHQYAVFQSLTKVWGTHTAKLGFSWDRSTNTQPGSGPNHGRAALAAWFPTSTGNTFADLLLGRTTTYYEQSAQVLHDVGWSRWELYAQDSWKASPRVTLNYGARLSYFDPVTDRQGNGLSVWDEARYHEDVAAGVEFPGVVWHGRDPGVPVAGVGSTWAVQPRVGFAWDVQGSGETVLRGGAGLYLWQDPPGFAGELIDLGAGVRRFEGWGQTLRGLDELSSDELVFGGSARDGADDRVPRMWSWSLTLNQRLPWSLSLELGYVGNRSDELANGDLANRNAVPLGAMHDDPWGDPQHYRPFPAYGYLGVLRHSLFRNYNGLQALLARQRGSFNFTLAYTFSKALGIHRADGGPEPGSEYVLSPLRDYLYGPLLMDRTHVATSSFTWLLPEPASRGNLQHLLGGWQLSGVLSYVSGAPLPHGAFAGHNFNIQGTNADGDDLRNAQLFSGSPDVPTQPVLTCDPRRDVPDGYLVNPACFAAPTAGQNGTYNLPYMKGQPYWSVDLAVYKNFDLGGDRKLQLRLSAYNAFNHPLAFPDYSRNLTLRFDRGILDAPGFGWLPTEDDPERGGANKAGRRIVQLAVRFTF
jgi:hypothetical protein